MATLIILANRYGPYFLHGLLTGGLLALTLSVGAAHGCV